MKSNLKVLEASYLFLINSYIFFHISVPTPTTASPAYHTVDQCAVAKIYDPGEICFLFLMAEAFGRHTYSTPIKRVSFARSLRTTTFLYFQVQCYVATIRSTAKRSSQPSRCQKVRLNGGHFNDISGGICPKVLANTGQNWI